MSPKRYSEIDNAKYINVMLQIYIEMYFGIYDNLDIPNRILVANHTKCSVCYNSCN